jgi:hypothetical protein
MKRLHQLLTIIILAALTFGGSFTCHASTDNDIDPPKNPRPAQK